MASTKESIPGGEKREDTRAATVSTGAFLRQMAVVLVLFAFLNVAVKIGSRKLQWIEVMRELEVATRAKSYDALFVGNSLTKAGISPPEIERSSVMKSFNIGINSTTAVQHLLVLRQVEKYSNGKKIPLVVYGLFHHQLSIPTIGDGSMNYLIDPGYISRFVTDNPFQEAQFRVTAAIPYLNQQSWAWRQVEKLRRKFEGVGMPPVETNQFGRADDFTALTEAAGSPKDLADIMAWADSEPDATPPPAHGVVRGTLLSEPGREIVAHVNRIAERRVFVFMPVTTGGRDILYGSPEWKQYQEALVKELRSKGIVFLDASEWIEDKSPDGSPNFVDAIHLSEQGGKLFSQRLGETLRRQLP